MKIIRDFGKALETMSKEIQGVPEEFYWGAGAVMLMLLILYFLVIPKTKFEPEKKARYRRYCIFGLVLIYGIGILVVTVFTREPYDEYRVQKVLLNGLLNADHLGRAAVRAVLNLVFFVPVGFFLAWACKGKWTAIKAAIGTFIFSGIVESCQFVGKVGTFDVDDLLFNTLGGLAGALFFCIWRFAFRKKSVVRYITRAALILGSLAVFGICGVLGTYHFLRVKGAEAAAENISTVSNRVTSRDERMAELSDDPDLIWYNGKAYRYNENLTTILFMGIDQRSEVIEKREGVSGESGQADTIFLLVMDQKKNKMKVIGISRDTMTSIPTYDYKGNYVGDSVNHLGLAYAFGDGKEISCQYMVDAVSNLFYGIPINAYVALNMEAVIAINDAVGGVPVHVPEDLTRVDPAFTAGADVTLMGRQALLFVKWRDTSVDNSNNIRMARQKQYMINFMKQAVQAVKNDATLPVSLYQSLTDEMVTDIGLDETVYFVTQVLSMSLDESGIMMLKSDAVQGSVYDEIYVDDDALYELILNIFYTEEKLEGEE